MTVLQPLTFIPFLTLTLKFSGTMISTLEPNLIKPIFLLLKHPN